MRMLSPLDPIFRSLGAQFIDQGGWAVPHIVQDPLTEAEAISQGVGLADASSSGKLFVQGQGADRAIQQVLGLDSGSLDIHNGMEADGLALYRLRPDIFFLHTLPGDQAEILARFTAAERAANEQGVTTTDVSHGLAEIALIGPFAPDLLRRVCGLDFQDQAFPDRTARQTSVAKTRQLILRRDSPKTCSYALIGDRSLAVYLWETLVKAGADLGITPVGTQALAQDSG